MYSLSVKYGQNTVISIIFYINGYTCYKKLNFWAGETSELLRIHTVYAEYRLWFPEPQPDGLKSPIIPTPG